MTKIARNYFNTESVVSVGRVLVDRVQGISARRRERHDSTSRSGFPPQCFLVFPQCFSGTSHKTRVRQCPRNTENLHGTNAAFPQMTYT
jgi:hypothetical protein